MNNQYPRKRLREIVSLAAKYGFKDGWTSPKNLRLLLEDLGPSFVKIGQILSTRPDILPDDYIDELKKLQDKVRPGDFSHIKALILEELGPLDQVFASFSSKPLASASLAEVYRGQLKTGEEIIVKVQRPGIKKKVLADLEILRRLAPAIKLTTAKGLIDMDQVIDELEVAMKKELNFLEERDNIKRFNKNNSNINFIKSPLVYENFCTDKILVMDYIEGVKIDEIDLLKEMGYDLEDLAEKLTYNFFQQVFDHGFFHADPHPGNILVADRAIGYIDFGLMGDLSPPIRKKLNTVLEALVKKDTYGLTKAILTLGIRTGEVDFHKLHQDISIIYNKYIDESIYSYDIGLIFNELVAICRENKLALPKDITLLAKTMLTVQGVLAKLSQEISIMDVALPFFKEKIIRETLGDRDFFKLGLGLYDGLEAIYRTPRKINQILDKTQEGDLQFKLGLNNLDQTIHSLSRMVNRLVASIIIVGILISSSLIVSLPSLKLIGTIGYLLASLLGLILLISIFNSKKK